MPQGEVGSAGQGPQKAAQRLLATGPACLRGKRRVSEENSRVGEGVTSRVRHLALGESQPKALEQDFYAVTGAQSL